MIAYPKLGAFGRLGNQLFQIAATFGCARDNDDVAAFPSWAYANEFSLLGATSYDSHRVCVLYNEPCFSYRKIPYLIHRPDHCQRLEGYFQSEKYFERHRSVISEMLRPHGSDPGADERAISVHVRRGDYLGLAEYHPPCQVSYYEWAISLIQARAGADEVRIFSDDALWCKQSLGHLGKTQTPDTPIAHLRQMIRCRHHVTANSAFSWWAAWLAERPDSVVVTPSRWFGPRGPQDTQDLIPERWERI